MLVAAKIRREERRLVDRLRDRNALTRERASALSVSGLVQTWVYERLVRNEVIRTANAGAYLDESGYAAFRNRRRRRAAVVLGILVVGMAAFYAWR